MDSSRAKEILYYWFPKTGLPDYDKWFMKSDEYDEENVLDGWEYQLSSQIPYLHWASAFVNEYRWDGILRDDIRGKKM